MNSVILKHFVYTENIGSGVSLVRQNMEKQQITDNGRMKRNKIRSGRAVNGINFPERNKQKRDWFSSCLEYQAQSNALFEYIMTEDGNDRQ
jgi:hypothetical protein